MTDELIAGSTSKSHRKLFSHGSVYAIATAAPTLVAALITPLLTRSLGPQQYGWVAIALSIVQVCHIIFALGLPASLARHVLLESTGARGAAGQIAAASALATAVAGVAVVVAATRPPSQSAEVVTLVALAVAAAAGLAVNVCIQSLTLGTSRPRQFVTQAIAISFVPPAAGLGLVLSNSRLATTYLWGYVAGEILTAAVLIAGLIRRYPPIARASEFRRAIRIGLPTVPHQLAGIAVPASLVTIAGFQAGVSGAGELQLALLVGTAPMMFLSSLNNSWSMQAYATPETQRSIFLANTAKAVSFVALCLTLGTSLLAPFVLAWLASSEMDVHQMVSAASFAACAAPVTVLYLANIHQVFASGATALLAVTTPLSALLAVSAAALVCTQWEAPAVPTLAAAIVPFAILQAIFSRQLRKRTGMKRLDLRVSVAFTIAAWLGVAILATVSIGGIGRVLLSVALVAAFAAFLRYLLRREPDHQTAMLS